MVPPDLARLVLGTLVSTLILLSGAPPASSWDRTVRRAGPIGRTAERVSRITRLNALFPAPSPGPTHPAERVVILSIDGLRPDAIGERTPTLLRLAREGATALSARTIDRSSTLPSHGSMMSGVGIEAHGLNWNAWRPERGRIRFPSVLTAAHRAGLRTSMFVGKHKLAHLVEEDGVDVIAWPGVFCSRVNRLALEHLAGVRSGVHFVHYADADGAGHLDGWMSPRYSDATEQVDRCLAQLVDTLERHGDLASTLLIVTSDHGGHGRTHGSDRPEDVGIPWIAWGGAARSGARPREVDTVDTAATVYRALGLPLPEGMTGRPVLEALR